MKRWMWWALAAVVVVAAVAGAVLVLAGPGVAPAEPSTQDRYLAAVRPALGGSWSDQQLVGLASTACTATGNPATTLVGQYGQLTVGQAMQVDYRARESGFCETLGG